MSDLSELLVQQCGLVEEMRLVRESLEAVNAESKRLNHHLQKTYASLRQLSTRIERKRKAPGFQPARRLGKELTLCANDCISPVVPAIAPVDSIRVTLTTVGC